MRTYEEVLEPEIIFTFPEHSYARIVATRSLIHNVRSNHHLHGGGRGQMDARQIKEAIRKGIRNRDSQKRPSLLADFKLLYTDPAVFATVSDRWLENRGQTCVVQYMAILRLSFTVVWPICEEDITRAVHGRLRVKGHELREVADVVHDAADRGAGFIASDCWEWLHYGQSEVSAAQLFSSKSIFGHKQEPIMRRVAPGVNPMRTRARGERGFEIGASPPGDNARGGVKGARHRQQVGASYTMGKKSAVVPKKKKKQPAKRGGGGKRGGRGGKRGGKQGGKGGG